MSCILIYRYFLQLLSICPCNGSDYRLFHIFCQHHEIPYHWIPHHHQNHALQLCHETFWFKFLVIAIKITIIITIIIMAIATIITIKSFSIATKLSTTKFLIMSKSLASSLSSLLSSTWWNFFLQIWQNFLIILWFNGRVCWWQHLLFLIVHYFCYMLF